MNKFYIAEASCGDVVAVNLEQVQTVSYEKDDDTTTFYFGGEDYIKIGGWRLGVLGVSKPETNEED